MSVRGLGCSLIPGVGSYCNGGHWSATDWFVLSELLDRKDVKLYYGSMIEWTADPHRPVETTSRGTRAHK
jgi:thiosulfate/3-mercaptopyruvate sulfurtransferase